MNLLTTVQTQTSNVETVEITHGYLPWLSILGSTIVLCILFWKILIPFFKESLTSIMDRNDKNIKTIVTSLQKLIEKLEANKVIILAICLLSHMACQPNDKITLHLREPSIDTKQASNSIPTISPEIPYRSLDVGTPIKPEIDHKEINVSTTGRVVKKKPKVILIKTCEPRCDRLETCNPDIGKCEGTAKGFRDNKWSPEKEHSEVFLVDSKVGTFSPGEEYLMKYR